MTDERLQEALTRILSDPFKCPELTMWAGGLLHAPTAPPGPASEGPPTWPKRGDLVMAPVFHENAYEYFDPCAKPVPRKVLSKAPFTLGKNQEWKVNVDTRGATGGRCSWATVPVYALKPAPEGGGA